MTRKEEIIFSTLELASEYGLKSVSLSQIADRVGIKKPSLYNHFKSKEEIVSSMYEFLREKAQTGAKAALEGPDLPKDRTLCEILSGSISIYLRFLSDKNMMAFFKVLYSERSISPIAAQIMLEETDRMISVTRNLFYSLVVHKKMKNENVDTAALSYAMTVHSLVDRHMDMITAGSYDPSEISKLPKDITEYIQWFCKQMGV